MDATKANTVLATLRVLLDALHNLQGSAAIQKLIDHGPLAQAAQAVEDERHALGIVTMMTKSLEAEVLPVDDFGPRYQSLDELILRSSRLVLLTQVSHLQTLAADIQPTQAAHMPQQAKYRLEKWLERACILSDLQAELRHVDEKWAPYHPTSAHPSQTTAIFYRSSVIMAQFAIRELGRNQIIARFFRDGTHVDHAVVQSHCETVLGVLELEITTIPDDLVNFQQLAVKQVSTKHDPGFDEDRSCSKRVGDRR